ncbi:helix-turn-helix domain-containing protein [Chryseobacterium vrystaatense]|uniref:HTH cro/C1-type domain-containing protein n=1 Tax=Chryseobacterium vrystaatense TaxID=307480 RepID=A0ABR4UGR8_9FLAO|nr:helix-turn-helix domain-containing protein [Chryseobacterium vrystaatense]KFF23738.1 hypothetical protein IW16_26290 [Chryseobacterium vrystaatense]
MKDIQDSYCIAVADHIKKFIDDNKIDLADLAAAANVDRKQVYRLINKENVPLLSTVVKIALAAGLEMNITHMDFDFNQYRKNNNILIAVPKGKSNLEDFEDLIDYRVNRHCTTVKIISYNCKRVRWRLVWKSF